jgi:hypothetical protein
VFVVEPKILAIGCMKQFYTPSGQIETLRNMTMFYSWSGKSNGSIFNNWWGREMKTIVKTVVLVMGPMRI